MSSRWASLHRQAPRGAWHMSSQNASFPSVVIHFSLFLVYCTALGLVLVGRFFFLNSQNSELGELIDISLPPKFQVDDVELKLRVYPNTKLIRSLIYISKHI